MNTKLIELLKKHCAIIEYDGAVVFQQLQHLEVFATKFAELLAEQPKQPIKDHELRDLVNTLRDTALKFHTHQSLRERIANIIIPFFRGEQPIQAEPVGEVADMAADGCPFMPHVKFNIDTNTLKLGDRFYLHPINHVSDDIVKDGWISVKDRLPNENTHVIVACEFDCKGDWRMKVGGLDEESKSGWHVFGASWKPTHWMPLPSAPLIEASKD